MSCFMLEPAHFAYMLDAAAVLGISFRGENGPTLTPTTNDQRAELFALLANENARSCRSRYPDNPPPFVPEYNPARDGLRLFSLTTGGGMVDVRKIAAILKACDCYTYQACEAIGHEETDAASFVRSLAAWAVRRLPGYDAAPWGIDEPGEAIR